MTSSSDDVTVEQARKFLVEGARRGFKYVRIYSRREAEKIKACFIGVEHGWLDEGELIEVDEQSSVLRYRMRSKEIMDSSPVNDESTLLRSVRAEGRAEAGGALRKLHDYVLSGRLRENLHRSFNGGHDGAACDAFHHGMDTVCNVLEQHALPAPPAAAPPPPPPDAALREALETWRKAARLAEAVIERSKQTIDEADDRLREMAREAQEALRPFIACGCKPEAGPCPSCAPEGGGS